MAKKSVATQDNGSRAVTQQGGRNAYQQFADEAVNQSSIEGSLLRFTKNGEWTAGQDEDELELGTRLIMGLNTLKTGWQKWVDGKPVDSRMGLISEGYRPADREELGDLDEDEWEVDPNNKKVRRDPWQATQTCLLLDPETNDVYTFASSSKSGKAALGEMAQVYGDRLQDGQPEEEMPIIELRSSSYKHKTYGKIFIPVFEMTGEWVTPPERKATPTRARDRDTGKGAAKTGSKGSQRASGNKGGQGNRTAPKALPAPRKSGGAASRI